MPFKDDIKNKVLLWSDRHCCFCKKQCGDNIEVHHIIPEAEGGGNDWDNAIPLCYDCHGIVGHYNKNHPKGNKIKEEELKLRRNQVFDEFTRHLIPLIHYKITEKGRDFPDVGFILQHMGNALPVKVKIILEIVKDADLIKFSSGHYSGDKLWNMNPHFSVTGHFSIPKKYENNDPLKIKISAWIIDQYKREHPYLPFEYVYVKETKCWSVEP